MDIYVDTASLSEVKRWASLDWISGLTTNPLLIARESVVSYRDFVRSVCDVVPQSKKISFEVLADDPDEMYMQGKLLHEICPGQVVVKIPVVNSQGQSTQEVIKQLLDRGIPVNITAIYTCMQVLGLHDALEKAQEKGCRVYLSLFCGRIGDCGYDPRSLVSFAVERVCAFDVVRVLWASVREVYNILQARRWGCHTITVPPSILEKYITLKGTNLDECSRETVRSFVDASQHIIF